MTNIRFPHLRLLLQTIAMTIAIIWPLSVSAAPPAVTGVKAAFANGMVHVTWDAPAGATTIAYYHVYFSRKSILQNKGEYDDFETTTGRVSSYDLKNFPQTDVLYVSVLAVDDQGNESDFFAEEAKADSKGMTAPIPPPPATPPPAPQQIPSGKTVQLRSAASLSSTGVILTFSEPVTVTPTDALTAFRIDDGSGHMLALRRLVFVNNTVQITTMPQQQGIWYHVSVSPVVHARALQPDGTPIPLDPVQNSASFGGAGIQPPPPPSPQPSPPADEAPPDVSNLRLSAEPETNGTYTVIGTWDAPAASIAHQTVMQTIDDGQTYSPAQTIGPDAQTIRVADVTSGRFGIVVQTVSQTGKTSQGTAASIDLPAINMPKKDLTQSGPEVPVAFAITGAGMGWFRTRRKQLNLI